MLYKRIEVCPRCKGSGRLIIQETEEEHLERLISRMSKVQLEQLLNMLKAYEEMPREQLALGEQKED